MKPKILGAQAVTEAQEISLHPVPVGSPMVRKIQLAPPMAEIQLQAKPPGCGGNNANAQGFHGQG